MLQAKIKKVDQLVFIGLRSGSLIYQSILECKKCCTVDVL